MLSPILAQLLLAELDVVFGDVRGWHVVTPRKRFSTMPLVQLCMAVDCRVFLRFAQVANLSTP
jgi:hypothetical protein